ncbi:MAG: hypothetical protein V3T41_01220, partial [bacterium]
MVLFTLRHTNTSFLRICGNKPYLLTSAFDDPYLLIRKAVKLVDQRVYLAVGRVYRALEARSLFI